MNTQPKHPVGLYDPRLEHDSCGVGFIADLRGRRTHDNVLDGLRILENLGHRGAAGADADTGDGAGILVQIPDALFRDELAQKGIPLPPRGGYAVGMLFLSQDEQRAAVQRSAIETVCREEDLRVQAWRQVPNRPETIGQAARDSRPRIEQLVLTWPNDMEEEAAERLLYLARRRIENQLRIRGLADDGFYVASLSCRTIVYKGMLTATQLGTFFPDLEDPRTESAIVLVHSRFSTNTFPNWARAHPYRLIAHNGEINTLRGNLNAMTAREPGLASTAWSARIPELLPVLDADGSDSAIFDNMLEFLLRSGRGLPKALLTMVPEPWQQNAHMDPDLRAFYEYQGLTMEPWDGPASISFSDGIQVGTILDRNGLRPARYWVLADGRVILASETGVLDVPWENIVEKGRVRPGQLFLVDTQEGRIVADATIKRELAAEHDYARWLDENVIDLDDLPTASATTETRERIQVLQHTFGFTMEDLRILFPPMAGSGHEAIGSMGTDTPAAVLSRRPQLLYSYFKQLFAQVTNPPLDGVREEIVTSMATYVGAQGNLLAHGLDAPRRVRLPSPVLTNADLARLRTNPSPRATSIPMMFDVERPGGLEAGLEDLARAADQAIAAGAAILILSDRDVDEHHAPIPALLALSSLHHHLIRQGTRPRASLIVESGEPREVHHVALLLGFGAAAVNPYLAIDTLSDLVDHGLLAAGDLEKAATKFVHALDQGVLKVMTKMGISTIQGYQGAQVFEALGIDERLIARHFTGTASRVGGIGLSDIEREARERHRRAYPSAGMTSAVLESVGEYQFRSEGQPHLFDPETVHRLQVAVRTGDYNAFREYSRRVNDHTRRLVTFRGLLELRPSTPIPIDEVEPIESIVRRFKTGAMSYGSISQEAHETLAIAMNRLGGKSNTGEGGEDPSRYENDRNGDSRNSAIKQVASARFGVTSNYLVHAQELQIKIAQGAKPGEGGQLPGTKVYPWIAKVRHSTPGVGLISPPPHHDIYSIEDLAQLIGDLRAANDRARISVKLVSESGVGTIAAGVAKAGADVILISGHDGGTGASPLTSIKHAGTPWELGLAETQQTLLLNKLRNRVVLETDGQLRTGLDVVIAALLGADEFGFATAPLVSIGCIMMRVCHLNTCPVGVATQDPVLRKRFQGDPSHVVHFMRFVAQEVREIMASLGIRRFEQLVGRTELLAQRAAVPGSNAEQVDLSRILHGIPVVDPNERYASQTQVHPGPTALESHLQERCAPAIVDRRPIFVHAPIRNGDRSVGTRLGSEVTRAWNEAGLPEDTIELRFTGSAGQSFGAFVPRGITMVLEGDANDYVGKGLSGGKIVVLPPPGSRFEADANVIVGNVSLYGATSGEAYILGAAGERFAVRNSGANAVVENVGDHGCEYMTGGRVLVLGRVGRNFAAGMSGGIAYVFDEMGELARYCNHDMVSLSPVTDEEDVSTVILLLRKHFQYTGSRRAQTILEDWAAWRSRMVRVLPNEYARARQSGLEGRAENDVAGNKIPFTPASTSAAQGGRR